MTYHLQGCLERDGFLFSYDVEVQQPARKLVMLEALVRPVVRLYHSEGLAPAAHGKAVVMLGEALGNLHRHSSHVRLGGRDDGAFTATVFAITTLTPEYVTALHAGLRERLGEQPINHYVDTYDNPGRARRRNER